MILTLINFINPEIVLDMNVIINSLAVYLIFVDGEDGGVRLTFWLSSQIFFLIHELILTFSNSFLDKWNISSLHFHFRFLLQLFSSFESAISAYLFVYN